MLKSREQLKESSGNKDRKKKQAARIKGQGTKKQAARSKEQRTKKQGRRKNRKQAPGSEEQERRSKGHSLKLVTKKKAGAG
jgi:hypothetical protein